MQFKLDFDWIRSDPNSCSAIAPAVANSGGLQHIPELVHLDYQCVGDAGVGGVSLVVVVKGLPSML